jgi:hypothetical protein
MSDFVLLVYEHFELMDRHVWSRVSKRLLLDVTRTRSITRIPELQFPFNANYPLNGNIADLTKQHGGNVHALGIVTITSKSCMEVSSRDLAQRNVADLTTTTIFNSDGDENQWICWDFHQFRIVPTHYSIRTFAASPQGAHLKSWVIESSIDGVNWREIDRQTDSTVLAQSCAVRSFPVSDSAECRFIRLTQTGPNHKNLHTLVFRAFEVFGGLRQ